MLSTSESMVVNVKWLGGVQCAFVQFAACSVNCTNAGCTAQLHIVSCIVLHCGCIARSAETARSKSRPIRYVHVLPDKYQ